MTTQIESRFHLREEVYGIAGILEDDLFDPRHHGLQPVEASTACYRGYHSEFSVVDSHLILSHLAVRLVEKTEGGYKEGRGPLINGIAPRVSSGGIFNNHYDGLKLSLSYTGGLLLIRGPVNDAPFRVWEYSTVLELIFDAGTLRNVFDRSASIAHIRKSISECFELTYML